jgi:hypothetical protein
VRIHSPLSNHMISYYLRYSVPPIPKMPQSMRQRSHSEDSVTYAANVVERAKNKSGRPKKASQHSDVIDRLDFTGVGPSKHHPILSFPFLTYRQQCSTTTVPLTHVPLLVTATAPKRPC